MKMCLHWRAIILFTGILALWSASHTGTVVRAIDPADLRGEITLQQAYNCANARRTALERYQLWHRVHARYGFPFYTLEEMTVLLYPAGKSDRLYVLVLNDYWPHSSKHGTKEFFCFQREGRSAKLIYKASVEFLPARTILIKSPIPQYTTVPESSYKPMPLSNLLSFLHDEGYAIKGKLSKKAQKDMTKIRDYIAYQFLPEGPALAVAFLSGHENAFPTGGRHQQQYDIDIDPRAGKPLSDEFFKKYGLPAARDELAQICGGKPELDGLKTLGHHHAGHFPGGRHYSAGRKKTVK